MTFCNAPVAEIGVDGRRSDIVGHDDEVSHRDVAGIGCPADALLARFFATPPDHRMNRLAKSAEGRAPLLTKLNVFVDSTGVDFGC